jgi:ankyrin repeat protein
MLEKGVNLRFRDGEGRTPLHACIDRQIGERYEILTLLIAAKADVNASGRNDYAPLHLAAVRDDHRAIRILLDAGANRDQRTKIDRYATPAEEARRLGHHRSADIIEQKYPFNDA